MSRFAVILAAAGKSTRFNDPHYTKPFARLDDRAVWLHSAEKFLNRADVKQLIMVVDPDFKQDFLDQFGPNVTIMGIDVVTGGKERWQSVHNALGRIEETIDFVAIHDAARPCLTPMWIEQVFAAATQRGAAILAAPITGTVKRSTTSGQQISIATTVDRKQLWVGQTPQVFKRQLLMDAYAKLTADESTTTPPFPTDDAQVVEQFGHPVAIVPCSEMNLKITTREDMKLAQAILKILPRPNFDAPIHPFGDDHLWR